MNIEEIRALVEILERSTLGYLEVAEGDFQLKLGRGTGDGHCAGAGQMQSAPNASQFGAAAASTAQTTAAPLPVPVQTSPATAMQEASTAQPAGVPVTSPMVGVFYAAPSPEAEPFVQAGQTVEEGQVLCIIEAMKLMNEITAEKSGVITEVCAKNGDIVEFGQPLFRIA